MRVVFAVALLLAMAAPGEARHRHWGGCGYAAAHGGPCGCVAMGMVGLRDARYWQVRHWLGLPRTAPHVGAAAVWRNGSHVEIVSAVHGDGTVSTRGSVGWHHVPRMRLVFVEPK